VATIASLLNFFFMLFVIPESVSQEQRDRAAGRTLQEITVVAVAGEEALRDPESPNKFKITIPRIFKNFFSPFAIFLPVPVFIEGSTRKRKDWSLTLLTCALFGYLLSAVRVHAGQNIFSQTN
jgi:hypothetical protein